VLVKSYQNKSLILGHELTENNVREFGLAARSATSRFSFAGSSLKDFIIETLKLHSCGDVLA
jgi:hypothetical protein